MIGSLVLSGVLAAAGLLYLVAPALPFRYVRYAWTAGRYTLAMARVFGVLLLVAAAVIAYEAWPGR